MDNLPNCIKDIIFQYTVELKDLNNDDIRKLTRQHRQVFESHLRKSYSRCFIKTLNEMTAEDLIKSKETIEKVVNILIDIKKNLDSCIKTLKNLQTE